MGGVSITSATTLGTMPPSLSNSNPSLAGSIAGGATGQSGGGGGGGGRPISLPTDGKSAKGE